MKKTLLIYMFIVLGITQAQSQMLSARIPVSSMATSMKWTGVTLDDARYTIWGGSPIIGEDKKVHVFCARWPQDNVDPGWRISSEVAHYVADQPEGPYRFVEVAVKGTGKEGDWDRYAPHNPEIKKIDDYYVLLYIANTNPDQKIHPSNQRIGMVYSKSIYGPWKRVGDSGMILEPSNDKENWTYHSLLGVSNPTLNKIGGLYYLYFKARPEDKSREARYGVAVSKHLFGPYKISDKAVTDNTSYLEDATSFSYKGDNYLITTDNFGKMCGIEGAGILWKSRSGTKYSLNDAKIAFANLPYYFKSYDEAKCTKIYGPDAKFERPKILFVDGKPSYFFAPSGWNPYGKKRTSLNILRIDHF